MALRAPQGIIAFSTVGLPCYGFDVFSVVHGVGGDDRRLTERRHTGGVSINFNAQFTDEGESIVFVSERTGSPRIYVSGPLSKSPSLIPAILQSSFHDRPTIRNGFLYFVSAHEPQHKWYRSWSAVYSTRIDTGDTHRLTPFHSADFSPAVSPSGDTIAVASYRSGEWNGEFHELETEIVVFRTSDPERRTVVASRGGWPTWAGEFTLFFHRTADDGWWSIYKVDLKEDLEPAGDPSRITPSGVHAFTPAAASDGRRVAVATRRKETPYRHIEIYDLETGRFSPVTEPINPCIHHYNPFFSPQSTRLGFHRFRGDSAETVPYFQPVESPLVGIRMLRIHGNFPSYSPDGKLIAVNGDFHQRPGLMVLRSDGSRRWTLLKESAAFYTAWSPSEDGVLYTSLGPIFDSSTATVQIARVRFRLEDLSDGRNKEDVPVPVPVEVKLLTTADTGNNAFPSVSPDGKWVVFRSGRSGQKNLYIAGSDGEGLRRLTEGEWTDTMPSWSPSGDLIAFSSNRHGPGKPEAFSVYLVRPDGTGVRRVHVAGPEGSDDVDRERINHVCFSPDGEWLLFTANLGGVVAEPVSLPNQFQPYGDLYTCRLDGTCLRRLTCNPYENGTPAWCADDGLGSMTLSELADSGDRLMGRFEEPIWLTCDI